MYQPNSVVPISDDDEQNKMYMIDITTHKIYYHFQKYRKPNIVFMVLIGGIISSSGILSVLGNGLYLNDASQGFKISLILASIVVSFLLLWLFVKKLQPLQLKEYLKKYPNAKELRNKDEIEKILLSARSHVLLMRIATVALLIGSAVMFYRFFINRSLGTYSLATFLFLLFALTLSNVHFAQFILKLSKNITSSKELTP